MSNDNGPGHYAMIGLGLVMAVVVITLEIYGLPPVSWINEWQAARMGGKYYPKLTFVILLLAVMIPGYIVYAVVKAVQETSDGRKRSGRVNRDDEEDVDDR